MPISVACDCGRQMRVKEEFAGRKVRCPACREVVRVPDAQFDHEVEVEVMDDVLADSFRDSTSLASLRDIYAETSTQITAETPSPKPKRKHNPWKASKKPSRDDEGWQLPRLEMNTTVASGLFMMALAAIWFFGGLALGVFFPYPPILFVVGIGAFLRGLMGRDD